MPVTIKQLAEKLGVSSATISRALNMEKGVSKELRNTVISLAKELSYHSDLRAKGLVTKKVNVITVIIPQTTEFAFSNNYYSSVLKGIMQTANKFEYFVLLSLGKQDNYAKSYDNNLSSGLIVITNRPEDAALQLLETRDIPLVMTPGYIDRDTCPTVTVDNFGGSFKATQYLLELGHRKIGFIEGVVNSKNSYERKAGYLEALKQYGCRPDKKWIINGDFTQEAGAKGVQAFFSLSDPPTAILTANDFTAIGALHEAKNLGLKIPKDLSVIGFGDIPIASMTDPPLTTVRAPYQKMGEVLTKHTIMLIEGKPLIRKKIKLPVEFVERLSTGKI